MPTSSKIILDSSSFADSIDRAEDNASLDDVRDSTAPMMVSITRTVTIPDPIKVARCRRLPEYGPRILFLSGGSALKDLSNTIKHYTHNSIHLITPFDSGGSSAEIRRAFNMLSVGDLRNRLMALSDDSPLGSHEIINLFSYRLSRHKTLLAQAEFSEILQGSHPLCRAVDLPMRSILTSHLRWFAQRMPEDFDLRGASIGNLIITGCYLEHNRDIVTAIYLIWKLLGVKGKVRPMTGANVHLRARYEDGMEEVGQHLLGKHPEIGIHGRLTEIDLVASLEEETEFNTTTRQPTRTCHIDSISADLLASADVLCYAVGSFFGSVLANLLPIGVGRAIVQRQCPKVYIPNTGIDPEMFGYTLSTCVDRIIDMVQTDVRLALGEEGDSDSLNDVSANQIVNFVVVDTTNCEYCIDIDKEQINSKFGSAVVIIDVCLANDAAFEAISASAPANKCKELDPVKLAEVLLTLGS